MANTTMIDYRRTDLRKNLMFNPYWITSSEIVGADAEDLAAVVFSFPTAGRITQVHQVALQITTVFTVGAGAAVGTLGLCTLATDAVTTAGTTTDVAKDAYLLNADITFGTAGYYVPDSAHTSAWLTSAYGGTVTMSVYQFITGAAATVPAVALYLTNAGGAITGGKCRVHMLISEIPGK